MHKRFVEPQKQWVAIVLKEGFSGQDIKKIANLIEARLGEFSSPKAPKRGNTR